jgi:signal transduction histidine kinase
MHPIKITCKMDGNVQIVRNAKFNLNIFRIVQEQLNNIIKHANASIVHIGYSQNDAAIILSITDNGSGFDTTKKNSGIGIINIKSRAKFFKGSANFLSKPGEGCILTVTFPVEGSLDKNL